MKKKTIYANEKVDVDYATLDEVIEKLSACRVKFGGDARFELDATGDYGHVEAFVSYQREETDAEYKLRMDEIEESREYRRKQYEILKKEFEK